MTVWIFWQLPFDISYFSRCHGHKLCVCSVVSATSHSTHYCVHILKKELPIPLYSTTSIVCYVGRGV